MSMTKNQIFDIIGKLKSAGVTEVCIRDDEGDSFVVNNEDSTILDADPYAIIIDPSRNTTRKDGQFNVRVIPYDNICHITAFDVSVEVMRASVKSFGLDVTKVNEIVQNTPLRRPYDGYDKNAKFLNSRPTVDEDGNPTLPVGCSGQVTY